MLKVGRDHDGQKRHDPACVLRAPRRKAQRLACIRATCRRRPEISGGDRRVRSRTGCGHGLPRCHAEPLTLKRSLAHETHDAPDLGQHRRRQHTRLGRTLVQQTVEFGRIVQQPPHFAGDRRKLRHQQIRQRRLEASKTARPGNRRARPASAFRQRPQRSRSDCPPRAGRQVPPPPPATGCGSVLAFLQLLRDRVRVVGQIDPRIFRRIGLRHLRRPVAQAHHPRRGPRDDRLGQRKEIRRTPKSLLNFCAMSRASSTCCF